MTAYDEYAVGAFEKEAVDDLLKPVSNERLEKTVKRLKEELQTGATVPAEILHRLMIRLSGEEGSRRLQYVRVQHGEQPLHALV